MIRRPPRSTLSSSSAASDVYKRQAFPHHKRIIHERIFGIKFPWRDAACPECHYMDIPFIQNREYYLIENTMAWTLMIWFFPSAGYKYCNIPHLSLIHISEPT